MEAVAKLRNAPYPARKMRLLADLIRGKGVDEALNVLRFHPKKMYSIRVEKLLLSAISNWQNKYEDSKIDENSLFIKHISVDNARQLKRIRPAPQGRAHRILKRFSHINLILDAKIDNDIEYEEMMTEKANTEKPVKAKKSETSDNSKAKLSEVKSEKKETKKTKEDTK